MKVLIIAPYFFEPHRWMISAYKTALHLSRSMDVVVLTTGKPAFEVMNPRLKVYRMWDIFLPDPVNYSIVPGLFWRIWKVIRQEKPDIFLVNKHMFFTSLAVPFLRLLRKKVILVTDTFPGINWQPRRWLVKVVMKIYAYVIGWPVLKSATKLVVLFEGLLPVAKKLGLQAQVIHNGVDIEAIDQAQPPTDLYKENGEIWVGYVGRLESIKGYDDYLAVAKESSPQYPTVKWFFVGSFHGKEEMVKQTQSEKIRFLGHVNNVYGIMKLLDIFVLPSYSEGLPNALMEAMAAGKACVASNVGGVKQLIDPGINGLTFTPGQRHELTEALNQLINNPATRKSYGAKARQRIQAEYNWDIISQNYQKLFSELLTVK